MPLLGSGAMRGHHVSSFYVGLSLGVWGSALAPLWALGGCKRQRVEEGGIPSGQESRTQRG